jgi:hypothetical protein
VRHARLDDVRIGAVVEHERDERGPHVVVTAVSPAERREIIIAPAAPRVVVRSKRLAHARAAPLGVLRRQRHDQIIRRGRAPHHRGPSAQLPFGEHRGERRVHGNVLDHVGLGSLRSVLLRIERVADEQLAEWLLVRSVVAPAQRCSFAGSQASEELEPVADATILRDGRRRDDRLDLVTREHRAVAPLGILVALGPELALVEAAGRLLDQVGELRVAKQRRHDRVDIVDRALRDRPLLVRADALEQVDDMPRADLGELHIPDHRKNVILESPLVVLPIEI